MAAEAPDEEFDRQPTRSLSLALAGVLLAVAAGGVVDLILDAPTEWFTLHVLLEVGLLLLSLGFAIYLWRGWWRTSRSLADTRRTLLAREAELRAKREAWRATTQVPLEALAQALDRQFDDWQLTTAEREVALHLLKGYGHKQIAALTSRSERTVRQHAVSVYRKANLSGRAELAAFFLGDLAIAREHV